MNLYLVGEAGSGKDQVASLLTGYHRIALADPIRDLVKTLRDCGVGSAFVESLKLLGEDNVPKDLMHILRFYSQLPRTSKERPLLQGIGTYYRECKDDVWINQGIAAMVSGSNVITDVRRRSELEAFKALGFKGIYVECPEHIRVARLRQRDGGYDESSSKHKAESEIAGLKEFCDYVVVNDGSLADLESKVDYAVHWLNFCMSN